MRRSRKASPRHVTVATELVPQSAPVSNRHLGVSRSLADLRFRQCLGKTIREAILAARLGEVKKRLLSTRLSAAKVARACGFTDVPHPQVVFKRRFGLPMGQWRRQAADEWAYAP